MALAIGPAYSTQARGKVGGITYCSGNSTAICKPTTFPCRGMSAAQTQQRRMVFSEVAWQWTNASLETRTLWEDFARELTFVSRLGRAYTPTGRQVYYRLCMSSLSAGYGLLVSPPMLYSPVYYPKLDIIFDTSGASLSWDTAIPAYTTIMVAQKRNLNLGAWRPRRTTISHRFTSADSSPQIICPPIAGGGGPGDFPPVNGHVLCQFHVWICDSFGRTSVKQFWHLEAK